MAKDKKRIENAISSCISATMTSDCFQFYILNSFFEKYLFVRMATVHEIVHIQMRWNHRFAIFDIRTNIFTLNTKQKNSIKYWNRRNKMVERAFVNTIYRFEWLFRFTFMHMNERYLGKYFTTGFTGGFYPEKALPCLLSQWIPQFQMHICLLQHNIFVHCNIHRRCIDLRIHSSNL